MQQDGVDYGKDRGVRADAEPDRDDSDGRQARFLPQHPSGVDEVLPKHVHINPLSGVLQTELIAIEESRLVPAYIGGKLA